VKLSQIGAQNMKQIPENVKTFPIPDSHLTGAAVLACSILDHQEATGDCRNQLELLRGAVAELREVIRWTVTEISDLLIRQDTALQLAVAAKDHPVFKAPDWFWQSEGTDTEKMLTRRARYLMGAKVGVDDSWDTLREFVSDTLRISNPDAIVSQAIKSTFGKREWGLLMPAPESLKRELQTPGMQPGNVLNLPPMPEGFTACDLMRCEFPEPKWIIPDILTEGLAILAGKPKTGKSWMALNLSVATSSGGRALGAFCVDKGVVLYLALEDTPRRLKSRLQQVLCGNMAPTGLHFMNEWPRIDQGALPLLERWLEAHPDTRFIIIDTLAKLWPKGNGKDSGNAYHQDSVTVGAIKDLAERHQIAILVVTHLRKSPTEDPLEQISGTMGISGSADTLLVLQRSRGKADANLLVTGRDIEEQELALRFDPVMGSWHHLGGADEYRRSQEQATILEALKATEEPLSPKEIAEMIGSKRNSVQFLLSKLSQDGMVQKVGHGKYTIKKNTSSSTTHFTHSAHSTHLTHFTHLCESEHQGGKMSGAHSSLDAYQERVCGKDEQSERSECFAPKIKCSDCQHFVFSEPRNLPGQCTGAPWDENRKQFPKIEHECEGFKS
jgi:hypothetical protein